ncbi:MAG: hypothetical protein IJJ33_09310, partial [Victivallales bacterium]|nr:hypothetical protein [Victivallales bacterium]
DRELCQRLATAFRKREMSRCAARMEHLLADYEELKKGWEKAKATAAEALPTSTTEPALTKDAAAPAKDAEAPAKDAAVPAKDEAPAKDAEASAKDASVPAKDAEAPAKDAEAPAKDAAAPAKDAIAPAKDAAAPAKDTAPAKDAAAPAKEKKATEATSSVGNSSPVVFSPDADTPVQASKKKAPVLSKKGQATVDQILGPIPGTNPPRNAESETAQGTKPPVATTATVKERKAIEATSPVGNSSSVVFFPDADTLVQASKKKAPVLSKKDQAIVDQILGPVPGMLPPRNAESETAQGTKPPVVPAKNQNKPPEGKTLIKSYPELMK